MSNEIPTRSRDIVRQREQRRCLRCGGPGAEWAHRRTRAVRDEHTHCPCNGAYLCRDCHQGWAHRHPVDAIKEGFAVSRHAPEPGKVAVNTWYGEVYLLCDGDIEFVVKGSNEDGPQQEHAR